MTKLGVVQTKSYKSNKEGIAKVSHLLKKMGHKETDILCLPEKWLPNNRISSFELKEFKRIAKEFSMTIIPGAFYEKKSKRWSISAPVIGPDGDTIGKQEKIHLFGYERKRLRPGYKTVLFKTHCKFGVIICYDMVFPQVARSLAQKGAEVLFSPSRIVKKGIIPWHQYAIVRALENRIPVLAANVENRKFGGKSVIIDLHEENGIVIPKKTELRRQSSKSHNFNLRKYKKVRAKRFADYTNFF